MSALPVQPAQYSGTMLIDLIRLVNRRMMRLPMKRSRLVLVQSAPQRPARRASGYAWLKMRIKGLLGK